VLGVSAGDVLGALWEHSCWACSGTALHAACASGVLTPLVHANVVGCMVRAELGGRVRLPVQLRRCPLLKSAVAWTACSCAGTTRVGSWDATRIARP